MGHEWVERPNRCLNGDGTGTKSNGGDTRRGVNATDGLGGRSDMSRENMGVPIIRNGTDTISDAMETISTHGDAAKPFS